MLKTEELFEGGIQILNEFLGENIGIGKVSGSGVFAANHFSGFGPRQMRCKLDK